MRCVLSLLLVIQEWMVNVLQQSHLGHFKQHMRYALSFSLLPAAALTTLYSETSADCSRLTVPQPQASQASPTAAQAALST